MRKALRIGGVVILGLLLVLVVAISLTIGWRPFIGPRARPLTIGDFTNLCAQHQFRIASHTYLQGPHRVPARFDTNLRATMAIFELK